MGESAKLFINDLDKESLQKLFKTSLESLNAGVWAIYPETGEELWAENFSKLLGYDKDQIPLSMEYFMDDLVHPDDKESFLLNYEEQILKGENFSFDVRLKTKSGNYRWFRSTGEYTEDIPSGSKKIVGLIIDVHESKTRKLNLQKEVRSSKEIREILEQTQSYAHIGTWQVNLENNKIFWSDLVYEIHELPIGSEINIETAINFYREDYRPVIQKAVNNCIENEESYDLECVLISHKGNEIWVRTMGYPYYENGNLVGLRGLFMDVNKEKKFKLEKDQLSLKFESIFNSTYNFIGLIEPDGTLIDANRSALDFGGFTIDDVRGKKFFDAPWWSLSEEIRNQLIEAIAKASDGEFVRYDVDVVGKDHQVITIDFSLSPIFNDQGKVIYIVPEGRNITKRKTLERDLELREKQLRRFVEVAPVAVAMLDKELRYITVSNTWYQDYEIEEKDVTGKSHYDVFPEISRREDWVKLHQRALKGESHSRDKDLFIRKDGSEQWINWKIIPWYEKADEVGGIMMFTIDVTEQAEYQAKLENLNEVLEERVKMRTLELDQAVKELESFSYSVSHDLRAPLRSVNSFADILVEEYGPELEEDALRYLKIIKDNGLRMGQLIDDILAFSRLGRKELSKSIVDMNDLFQSVVAEVEGINPNYNSTITVDEMPGAKGDPSLLKQVLFNLVANAFKYSSKKDHIFIKISSETNENMQVYSITDNGVGFDMKYHDKMFGVFQRLHPDSEFSGTGVGLAIVRRIISKHGGKVWAKSKPGKGSTFYFSLPIT
ncbi:PAS domain S-box protein [Balneola sp. MJW-20]|uniref:PAS domain-containing sensor histidine kinase n=1 Tax=Gracilimonas aurantiaca TaxID=3234185 RepID=UPI003467B384